MLYHTVKTFENIKKIAEVYHLNIEEIKEINQHIRNWDKLTPGTKLRLPEISDLLTDHIDQVEPFIEDYYPRINLNDVIKPNKPVLEPVATPQIPKKSESSGIKLPNNNNEWIYPWMYNYSPYYQYRKPNKSNKKDAK